MKTILRTATLVVWAVAAFGQEELKSWVPTNWGDTRIYQHESGKERWKTEETIEKPISVPEGTIVIRGIRTFDGKPPSPEAKKEAWLIHGDCLVRSDAGRLGLPASRSAQRGISGAPAVAGRRTRRRDLLSSGRGENMGQGERS